MFFNKLRLFISIYIDCYYIYIDTTDMLNIITLEDNLNFPKIIHPFQLTNIKKIIYEYPNHALKKNNE